MSAKQKTINLFRSIKLVAKVIDLLDWISLATIISLTFMCFLSDIKCFSQDSSLVENDEVIEENVKKCTVDGSENIACLDLKLQYEQKISRAETVSVKRKIALQAYDYFDEYCNKEPYVKNTRQLKEPCSFKLPFLTYFKEEYEELQQLYTFDLKDGNMEVQYEKEEILGELPLSIMKTANDDLWIYYGYGQQKGFVLMKGEEEEFDLSSFERKEEEDNNDIISFDFPSYVFSGHSKKNVITGGIMSSKTSHHNIPITLEMVENDYQKSFVMKEYTLALELLGCEKDGFKCSISRYITYPEATKNLDPKLKDLYTTILLDLIKSYSCNECDYACDKSQRSAPPAIQNKLVMPNNIKELSRKSLECFLVANFIYEKGLEVYDSYILPKFFDMVNIRIVSILDKTISFVVFSSLYRGGASTMRGESMYTYDLKTGKALELKDIENAPNALYNVYENEKYDTSSDDYDYTSFAIVPHGFLFKFDDNEKLIFIPSFKMKEGMKEEYLTSFRIMEENQ